MARHKSWNLGEQSAAQEGAGEGASEGASSAAGAKVRYFRLPDGSLLRQTDRTANERAAPRGHEGTAGCKIASDEGSAMKIEGKCGAVDGGEEAAGALQGVGTERHRPRSEDGTGQGWKEGEPELEGSDRRGASGEGRRAFSGALSVAPFSTTDGARAMSRSEGGMRGAGHQGIGRIEKGEMVPRSGGLENEVAPSQGENGYAAFSTCPSIPPSSGTTTSEDVGGHGSGRACQVARSETTQAAREGGWSWKVVAPRPTSSSASTPATTSAGATGADLEGRPRGKQGEHGAGGAAHGQGKQGARGGSAPATPAIRDQFAPKSLREEQVSRNLPCCAPCPSPRVLSRFCFSRQSRVVTLSLLALPGPCVAIFGAVQTAGTPHPKPRIRLWGGGGRAFRRRRCRRVASRHHLCLLTCPSCGFRLFADRLAFRADSRQHADRR